MLFDPRDEEARFSAAYERAIADLRPIEDEARAKLQVAIRAARACYAALDGMSGDVFDVLDLEDACGYSEGCVADLQKALSGLDAAFERRADAMAREVA